MFLGLWSAVVLMVAWIAPANAASIDTVEIKGSHFFYKNNGSEFFVRGVTYQPRSNSTPIDPLAVSLTCMRDIQFLSQLSTNVIRVAYLDSGSDHSACMVALENAGIYVLVDLPGTASINSTNPEWNWDIYGAWTNTIDAMAGYNNVFGFFAGSKVVTNSSDSPSAAFVKAAVRDLKSYIATKNYRKIPVGYEMSASDNYDVASMYMTCNSSSESIDFLGISDFNWCSNSTFLTSGYQNIINLYGSYRVPVFFSQYGCRDVASVPREFDEIQTIYGPAMTDTLSGGIVYEYFKDQDNLGLVSVLSPSSVSPLPDYTSYSSQMARITPSPTAASSYTITNTITQACPTAAFSASPTLPPIVDQDVCTCMMYSLNCVANPSLNASMATSILEGICGDSSQDCAALQGDGMTGIYGAYSMCNATARLSWAFSAKYHMVYTSSSQYNAGGCNSDPNAVLQSQSYWYGCSDVLAQAGPSGTGTVTSFPTLGPSQTSTSITYTNTYGGSNSLSNGAIAGIVLGSILAVGVITFAALWFCCIRKRRAARRHQDMEPKEIELQDSTQTVNICPPYGTREERISMLSDDSRTTELPPFDSSYMGSATQRSRNESRNIESEAPAGYRSVSERNAAIEDMHRPVSRLTNPEQASPTFAPSPSDSNKGLPAFGRNEDKSLASIKLLAPMVQVSPVESRNDAGPEIRRKPVP